MNIFERIQFRFGSQEQKDGVLAGISSEILHTPRELNQLRDECIREGAKRIRGNFCPEWLYVVHLPMIFTPDKWEQVAEMMQANYNLPETHGIEIMSPPLGTPPEIAEGWVGCTIPFSDTIHFPLIFQTPELEECDMTSPDERFYVVSSAMGLTKLDAHDRSAAKAYRDLRPYWSNPGEKLIFNSDCCKVVDMPNFDISQKQ